MIKSLLRSVKHTIQREISKSRWRRTQTGKSAMQAFSPLKDKMKGHDAIIMCNGPSLNKVSFEDLKDSYVIGMNKINLLFDRTTLRPDLIVAINKYVIEQNADFYNETDIPLMLSDVGEDHVRKRQNVVFMNSFPTLQFSIDPSLIIYEGWTVTYAALQIAFYMGFDRVAIVGADHNFNQVGMPNELQVSKGADSNHFDPRYFGAGTPWQLADLEGSERAYRLARNIYEARGRKLYNCTEGGMLEIFDRMPLATFLNSSENDRRP